MFVGQIRRLKLLTGCQRTTGLRFLSLSDSARSDEKEEAPAPKKLKQWRAHIDPGTKKLLSKLKVFDLSEGRPPMDFIAQMNAPWDVSLKGIKNWMSRKRRAVEIDDQRFVKERHEILGSNLAAAHFIVHRGGKVKFSGRSEWVESNKNDDYKLPTKYMPDYTLEAIDANGINLYYEGLTNMRYLYDLKFLSLKGCKTIDDWCLDRLSSQYPRLEHLDVSNCINVSERGLEALYRMQSLKVLVVTNHYNSPAFDLTCMMLEDCNPKLRCVVERGETEASEKKIEAEEVASLT